MTGRSEQPPWQLLLTASGRITTLPPDNTVPLVLTWRRPFGHPLHAAEGDVPFSRVAKSWGATVRERNSHSRHVVPHRVSAARIGTVPARPVRRSFSSWADLFGKEFGP